MYFSRRSYESFKHVIFIVTTLARKVETTLDRFAASDSVKEKDVNIEVLLDLCLFFPLIIEVLQ